MQERQPGSADVRVGRVETQGDGGAGGGGMLADHSLADGDVGARGMFPGGLHRCPKI